MLRSRLSRVRSKRDSKLAVIYLVLAGLIIVGMITWGVPWMARMAGLLITEDTGAGSQTELRPTAPIFSDIPEASREDKISLGGFAQPGVEVALFVNGAEVDKLLTDDAGVFYFDRVGLTAGDNLIYAYALTSSGGESEQSKEYVITLDNEPPELTLSAPEDGETFRTQAGRIVTFQGIVNEDKVRVTVGDRLAIVSSDGSFSVAYQLAEGEQEVKILVVDRAGNETEKLLKLRWEP